MYSELIAKSGLSKDQADIYSTLLEGGHMTARKISVKTGLKRGLAYKVLDQLIEMGLIEKNDKIAKVALFFPAHPSKIKEVLKKRQEEIANAESALGGVMNQMISTYNLISGKPNVQFFEGEEGVWKVLDDSLTSSETIDAYSDIESIEKYIPEINKKYVEKREKLRVKKRGLILDTAKARQLLSGYHTEITENRFIKCSIAPSQTQTIIQIYDNKVSFITLGENIMFGTIIENTHIYSLHKYLFECLWENSKA